MKRIKELRGCPTPHRRPAPFGKTGEGRRSMASLMDDRKGCFNGFDRWILRLKTRHTTPRKTVRAHLSGGLGGQNGRYKKAFLSDGSRAVLMGLSQRIM